MLKKTFKYSAKVIKKIFFNIFILSFLAATTTAFVYYITTYSQFKKEYLYTHYSTYDSVLGSIKTDLEKIIFYKDSNILNDKNKINDILNKHKDFDANILSFSFYTVLDREIIASTEESNIGGHLKEKWFKDCLLDQDICYININSSPIISLYLKDALLEKTYGLILTYDAAHLDLMFNQKKQKITQYSFYMFFSILLFFMVFFLLFKNKLYTYWYKANKNKQPAFLKKTKKCLDSLFKIFPHDITKPGWRRWFIHQSKITIFAEIIILIIITIRIDFLLKNDLLVYIEKEKDKKFNVIANIVSYKINNFEKLGIPNHKMQNFSQYFEKFNIENYEDICIKYYDSSYSANYSTLCEKSQYDKKIVKTHKNNQNQKSGVIEIYYSN